VLSLGIIEKKQHQDRKVGDEEGVAHRGKETHRNGGEKRKKRQGSCEGEFPD